VFPSKLDQNQNQTLFFFETIQEEEEKLRKEEEENKAHEEYLAMKDAFSIEEEGMGETEEEVNRRSIFGT
jgi:hypothetical protein